MSPAERLAEAAATFLAAMPPELVEESRALVELDPSVMGVRVHYRSEPDLFDLTWVGRWLGSVKGSYVRTGESSP